MSKRIVEYHISRLQEKNPAVRLQAIEELILLADLDSLEALKAVYENDPEEEIRIAARKAGQKIFAKHQKAKNEN